MSNIASAAKGAIWALPLLIGLIWTQWYGYEGLNGADSHDYFRVASAWSGWIQGAERPAAAEHPPAFPFAGALLGGAIGEVHLALRIIPFIAFLLLGLMMVRMVRRTAIAPEAVVPFVLLCLGASPFLLRHALVVMSDLPGAALVFIVFSCLVTAQGSAAGRWLVVAVLVGMGAVAVRFAALPLLGGALLFFLWNGCSGRSALAIRAMLVILIVTTLVLFTIRPAWLAERLAATPLEHWSVQNCFHTVHRSDDGELRYRLPNILYVASMAVHPGFVPIGLLLLPFIRRIDFIAFSARLACWMVVPYLFFTAGLPFQNDRVMLMALPFVAFLFFPAFTRAFSRLRSHRVRPALVVGAIAVLQLVLFARAMWPFMRSARIERELAGLVTGLGVHHVYTHGMGPALSNYCPGVTVTELWYDRIDRFEPGALVLVDPKNLEDQWQGLHPWENWQRARAQGLDTVIVRTDNWSLLRVR